MIILFAFVKCRSGFGFKMSYFDTNWFTMIRSNFDVGNVWERCTTLSLHGWLGRNSTLVQIYQTITKANHGTVVILPYKMTNHPEILKTDWKRKLGWNYVNVAEKQLHLSIFQVHSYHINAYSFLLCMRKFYISSLCERMHYDRFWSKLLFRYGFQIVGNRDEG